MAAILLQSPQEPQEWGNDEGLYIFTNFILCECIAHVWRSEDNLPGGFRLGQASSAQPPCPPLFVS